jgi:hypothetical protein
MKRLLFFLSILITVSIQAQTYKPVSILPAYTPAVGHVPIFTNTPASGWQSRPLAIADIAGLTTELADKLSSSTPPVFSSLKVGSNITFPTLLDGAGVAFSPTAMVNTSSGQAGFAVHVNDGTFNTRLGMFVDNANGIVGLSQTQSSTSRPFVYRNSNGEAFRVNSNRTWNWPAYNVANGFIMSNGTGDISAATAATVKGILNYSTTDVTEGTNLYYTNTRARSAINLTTTGTSGVATYDPGTGVLNIPNYAEIGGGDVVGPASSTTNALAKFTGTTGKLLSNTGVVIDASDNFSTPGNIYSTGGSQTSTYGYRGIYFNPASTTAQLTLETSGGIEGGFFTNTTSANVGSFSIHPLNFLTSNVIRASITSSGTFNIANLSGTGTRMVTASSTGDLSTATLPTGDVAGPASSTTNAIAKYTGTTGKALSNSAVTIDASNNVTTPGNVYAGNIVKRVLGTGTVANSTTTFAGTGLVFPVTANQRYHFKFWVVYTSASTGTGAAFSIDGPTLVKTNYFVATSNGTTSMGFNNRASYNTGAANLNSASGTDTNSGFIEGEIECSASGDVELTFFSEVAASAITLNKALSWVEYYPVITQ